MIRLVLVVGSIVLCGIAYTYFCIKRAGRAISSLLYHCGAVLVIGLVVSQYGALMKADSLGISEQLLSYCVCGACLVSLLYFLFLLFICRQIGSCVAQVMLLSVVGLFGCVCLLLEFGAPIHSHFERHSRSVLDYVVSLTPYRNK